MDDLRDRELRDELRRATPPADFDREAVRRRIETSLGGTTRGGDHASSRFGWAAWVRAAASIALLGGGIVIGRATAAPSPGLPVVVSDPPVRPALSVEPSQVPLSIQEAGTDYVSALALFSETRRHLTPAQREEAREVAIAVLSGAIAEILLAEDEPDPGALFGTLMTSGLGTSSNEMLLWR